MGLRKVVFRGNSWIWGARWAGREASWSLILALRPPRTGAVASPRETWATGCGAGDVKWGGPALCCVSAGGKTAAGQRKTSRR